MITKGIYIEKSEILPTDMLGNLLCVQSLKELQMINIYFSIVNIEIIHVKLKEMVRNQRQKGSLFHRKDIIRIRG